MSHSRRLPQKTVRDAGVPAASLGTSCGTQQPAVSSWPAVASLGTAPCNSSSSSAPFPPPARGPQPQLSGAWSCVRVGTGIQAKPAGGHLRAAAISVARSVTRSFPRDRCESAPFTLTVAHPLSPQHGSAPGCHVCPESPTWT